MIKLFSGTPGSGKSYHAASIMYHGLRKGQDYICNFPVALDNVALSVSSYYKRRFFPAAKKLHRKKIGNFIYADNNTLTPDYLTQYAKEHHSFKREGETTVIIDECGIIFNSRSWDNRERLKWIEFLSMHRHYGYNIVLISQSDRMIDRQIRCFIEYDIKHRKVNNYKLFGRVLGVVSGGCLFVCITNWYGAREKVGSDFLRYKRRVASLYDTFLLFGETDATDGVVRDKGCAERGVPLARTDSARSRILSKFFELFARLKTRAPHPDEEI